MRQKGIQLRLSLTCALCGALVRQLMGPRHTRQEILIMSCWGGTGWPGSDVEQCRRAGGGRFRDIIALCCSLQVISPDGWCP